MITSRLRRGRPVAALALAVATAVGLSACGSGSSGSGDPKTVNLVAYSVPKPAYDALTTAFGLWLLAREPVLLETGWLRAKLALVALLIGYHAWLGKLVRDFAAGRNAHSPLWYRWFNEVPTLLLIGIVLLAVARPL